MNNYKEEVALYIIDNHTIQETADYFHKSVSSIKKYLAIVRNPNDVNYDASLAEKLKLAQAKIVLDGAKKGGMLGKRSSNLTEAEKREYAKMWISGLTLEELALKTDIPKSTLQENIRSIKDDELQTKINQYLKGEDIWKR